jgi:hypothetical protein
MKIRGHPVDLMVDTGGEHSVVTVSRPPFTEPCNYYLGYGELGLLPLLSI